MKKYILVLSGILSLIALMAFTGGGGNDPHSTGGAPAGYAGDPSAGGATCRSCHSGPVLPALNGVITSNIPPAGYTPNTTYTITAAFVRPGHSRFGFQISPQNASGTQLGTMANITGTQLVGSGKYITHVTGSTTGSGSKTWNFSWTAPASGAGSVTFYGAFNAANNNGQFTGDSIFTSTLTVTENATGVGTIAESAVPIAAFPNPTSGAVNVSFHLSEESAVELSLFDISGNKVAVLAEENGLAGSISKKLDISSHPEGIYFLRLSANGNTTVKKLIKL